MRWFLTIFCSVVSGAIAGAFMCTRMIASSVSTEQVDTKSLLLLDEIGRPAIRMQTLQNQTKMEFLANGNVPILTLRVNRDTSSGLIEFTKEGATIAGLQVRPNSESELFLGDRGMVGRVVLGAPGSDVGGDPTELWGLQIQSRRAGNVTIGVANDQFSQPGGPFFGFHRADGTFVSGAFIPKVQ